MSDYEIKGTDENDQPLDQYVSWFYPDTCSREKSHIILQMLHTMAVDDIRISYSSEREGWIIEQASVFEWEFEDEVCDPDWQEVAFIPAWGRDKRQEGE